MKLSPRWPPIIALGLVIAILSACSLDPNARKRKYFESGQGYFEKHQFQEAAVQFTNAIQIDPGFANAHFQLAETYMNLQQSDRAYQEFARTVELRPEDDRARVAMTNLLILDRDFHKADEQTELLLKKRPNDPAIHAMAASLLAAEGKIPDAIKESQQTIALAPGRWETYLSLALLQVKNNELSAAETSFKKVIELNPKAMQARLLLGSYYQSHDRLNEAEQQFHDAITLDPNSIDPREALARLYLAEGRKADAEAILKQAKLDLPHNPGSFLALSNFYFMNGDIDSAVAEYHALYQERPKDLQVKKKYIQLLIQAKRFDEARNLDDEILKTTPNDDDALVYRSQMQISSGDLANATQTLQAVTKNAPDNSLAHYALGVAFEKQGSLERAENEWRTALRLNPDFLDAQRAIANSAILTGDMNSLEDSANQIIRLQPGSPDGYALRGLANINRKQYGAAEEDIRRSIAAAPQSAFGYVQLGNLRFAEKQYNDAIKPYQDALDRNVNSTDALRGLMNTYVVQKQIDKAVAAANAQVYKSPANSSFYNLLGNVLFHNKEDLSGAEAAFQKSIALNRENLDAVVNLCQLRAASGKIDEAIATCEQSLKESPRQTTLYLLLGNFYESKSDWKKAADEYSTALTLNSRNPVASNDLARVMVHTGGNLDVALSMAQTARRELPDSPGVADTVGWIYFEKGIYPLAINNLQEALKLQDKNKVPDNPDIHFHLGMSYEKSAQPVLARQQYEHVLKMYPNYRDASEIKKALIRLKS
ncbi:MAG: tetratricopeptide repeat protein [Terracidiphilus sp.]